MKKLLSAILFLMLSVCAVCTASALTVLPLGGQTHAVLLQEGQSAVLVGAGDADEIERMLKDIGIRMLDSVVMLCSDEAHTCGAQAVASLYACDILGVGETFQMGKAKISWEGKVLVAERGQDRFLFGAKNTEVSAVAYGCDGILIPYTGATNEAAVNVRGSSSTKGERVGKLQRGEQLKILGTVINAAGELWYEVRLGNGTQGYIRSDLLGGAELPVKQASMVGNTVNSSSSGFVDGYDTTPTQSSQYIGNKNTKKFHKPSCNSLPATKNQVYFSSRDKAVSSGYVACKRCKP